MRRTTWLDNLVSVGRGLQLSLTAHPWTVAGTPGPCSLAGRVVVVVVEEVEPPWPNRPLRRPVPTPPLKYKMGSAVP